MVGLPGPTPCTGTDGLACLQEKGASGVICAFRRHLNQWASFFSFLDVLGCTMLHCTHCTLRMYNKCIQSELLTPPA